MTDDLRLSSYEPIPAKGAGAESFDKPALFYLTHQVVIEEWHGLRRTVSEAVNSWLDTTVHDALAAFATERGLLLSRVYGPQKQAHLLTHPDAMPLIDGRPILGVGLAWPSASVSPRSNAPYACVRRSSSKAGKAAATALLNAGGRQFRSREGLKGHDDDVWPLYSWIAAKPTWWTDLDAYVQTIMREVERFVDGLAGPLAEAMSEVEKLIGDAGEYEDSDEP